MECLILGSGSSYNESGRETTMLAVMIAEEIILVDCGGNAIAALQRAGRSPTNVQCLMITHAHPDHVTGFPLLIQQLWLSGRRTPFPVYGPASALHVARHLLACFDTSGWEGLFPINWHPIPPVPFTPVTEGNGWQLLATPGEHSQPVIGLRWEMDEHGMSLTYSSDTAPTPQMVEFARGTDLLVHEATGAYPGHSSLEEALMVARDANVRTLCLVHLPRHERDIANEIRRVQKRLGTDIEVLIGRDGLVIPILPHSQSTDG